MTIDTQTPAAASNRYPLSLRAKLVLGFTLLSAFVSFITARGMYTNLQNQAISEFRSRVLALTQFASVQQNGDEFQVISSGLDAGYERVRAEILAIRSENPDISRIFTMRKDAQGIYYVVDVGEPAAGQLATFGQRYINPSELLAENFDSMTTAIIEPEIADTQSGSFWTAYAPILTSAGEQVGVIGVDISADTILQGQSQILSQAFLVFLVALGLGLVFGYVAGRALTEPVKELIRGAQAFAAGYLEQKINIPTRD